MIVLGVKPPRRANLSHKGPWCVGCGYEMREKTADGVCGFCIAEEALKTALDGGERNE